LAKDVERLIETATAMLVLGPFNSSSGGSQATEIKPERLTQALNNNGSK
jgi:hypothetical protein